MSRPTEIEPAAVADLEVEMSLLGALMHAPSAEAVQQILVKVAPENFYATAHALLYGAIASSFITNGAAAPLMVRAAAEKLGTLEKLGGAEAIGTAFIAAAHAANVDYYAERVLEKSRLRKIITACQQASFSAQNNGADAQAVLSELRDSLESCERDFLNLESLFPRTDLAQVPPPPEWIVQDLLQKESLGFLFGSGGTGKSFLSLKLALAAATGKPFLCYPVPRPVKVLFLDFEMSLREAQKRVKQLLGVDETASENLYYCNMHGPLHIETELPKLIGIVKAHAAELVVADPFAYLHGLDENDNGEMSRVMAELRRLVHETRCFLLVDHHTRKARDDKRASSAIEEHRGATSLRDLSDVAFTLTKQGGLRIFKQSKNRLGPEMAPLEISFTDRGERLEVGFEVRRSREGKVEEAIGVVVEYLKQQPEHQAGRKAIVAHCVTAGVSRWAADAALSLGVERETVHAVRRGVYGLSENCPSENDSVKSADTEGVSDMFGQPG